jgi:hypothetical protein
MSSLVFNRLGDRVLIVHWIRVPRLVIGITINIAAIPRVAGRYFDILTPKPL